MYSVQLKLQFMLLCHVWSAFVQGWAPGKLIICEQNFAWLFQHHSFKYCCCLISLLKSWTYFRSKKPPFCWLWCALYFHIAKNVCPLLQKQNNALHESPLEMCQNYEQIHLATGKRTQLQTQYFLCFNWEKRSRGRLHFMWSKLWVSKCWMATEPRTSQGSWSLADFLHGCHILMVLC